ncbi:hypothetical protein BMS3Abin10_02041 [bacterium BMS3Abin10]|nr:hypothetical protein BMS3Abin10_02041 [bacterium BMS3Abin10]GBE39386.1 hypothetical protein BMS3Bbin08_02008 [bacterium BMS3Bbin08]
MTALTTEEILSGLEKLGIDSLGEREDCVKEYALYCILEYLDINFPARKSDDSQNK